MRQQRHARALGRIGTVLLLLAAPPLRLLPAEVDALLDGLAARLERTAAYKNWTAASTQTVIEEDRKGRPEKITVVSKAVRVTDGRRQEDILKAVVTEDGRTKDITATYELEARERRREAERRAAEEPGSRPAGRRGNRLVIEDILPFSAARRSAYSFGRREAVGPDGRRLVLLEAKAKTKDDMSWNGTYTIDPETYDILQAELRPSKLPRLVKELSVQAEVEILDGKYFVLKRTKFKVNGGFLFIKRVRMTVEEVYSDVRVLDPGTAT